MWSEDIVAGRPAWRHDASGVVFREVLLAATRYAHHQFTAVRPVAPLPGAESAQR